MKKTNKKSVHLITPYYREHCSLICLGLITLIIVDFLQLFIPRIIKWAVDDLTAQSIDHHQLLYYGLYIASIGALIAVLRYIWRFCLLGTSRRIEEGLRNQLFGHIQTLSASYFMQMKTGDLMAHATNDIGNIRMACGMGLVALTDTVVLGTASIGFMMLINVKLSLLALIPMPMIIITSKYFGRKLHKNYQAVQSSFADMTELIRERFAGIRIIKAYHKEQNEIECISNISQEYVKNNIRLATITSAFFPMILLFSNISLVIIIGMGGRLTIINSITAGDFVAFLNYLALLTWPMMALGWLTNLIQRGKASLDRINKILETHPDISDQLNAYTLQGCKGDIRFQNICFSYQSLSKPLLSKINLHIETGMTVGIMGPSGSGKTSLLNLLQRLYDVQKGQILLDGIQIKNICLNDLRAQIAFVPQEAFLFAGTIWDNICFGRTTSEKSMRNALKLAALDATIASFPDGLKTIVGEKGVILSGGQKQRIGIARAFLSDAPILILDDPVSQVDAETSNILIESFQRLKGQKTIIIVSHRISAIRFADRIVVLKQGNIVASGTHDMLIKAVPPENEYYAQTYRLQEIEEKYHAL